LAEDGDDETKKKKAVIASDGGSGDCRQGNQ
jgi:hypothetical protein